MTASEAADLVGVPLLEFDRLPASFNPTPQHVSVTTTQFDYGSENCGINLIYTAPPKLPKVVIIRVEIRHRLSSDQIRSATQPPTPLPNQQLTWNCMENTYYNMDSIPTICTGNLYGYYLNVESPYQMEGTQLLLSGLRLAN